MIKNKELNNQLNDIINTKNISSYYDNHNIKKFVECCEDANLLESLLYYKNLLLEDINYEKVYLFIILLDIVQLDSTNNNKFNLNCNVTIFTNRNCIFIGIDPEFKDIYKELKKHAEKAINYLVRLVLENSKYYNNKKEYWEQLFI